MPNGTTRTTENGKKGADMQPRVRAVLLAGAALVALAPSTAALAAHRVLARSHAGDQGLTWSVVPSPNRKANPSGNQLFGVTCLSATSCTAVGYGAKKDLNSTLVEPKTLVERWNGTAWSIVPSPNRAGLDELQGVSCVSASACTAVGESAASPTSPSSYRTLIETWNGTAWSIVPSPNPGAGTGNFLFGVSCVTAAFCAAVGHYGPPSTAKENPITEIWNGSTWSVAPNPPKLHNADLESVSCISATACIAAGSHRRIAPPARGTLIESWNGSSWSVVPSPNAGTDDRNSLSGVSCTSATACTAVGTYFDTGLAPPAQQTLIESWNGSSWSVVPSPDPGTGDDNFLNGVSCASPASCNAVGTAFSGSIADAVIEAWNGTTWSAVPSLVSKNIDTILSGVSCPSVSMCMAAGTRNATEESPLQTLTALGTSSG
jgi:hypothetical protein